MSLKDEVSKLLVEYPNEDDLFDVLEDLGIEYYDLEEDPEAFIENFFGEKISGRIFFNYFFDKGGTRLLYLKREI